MKKVTIQKIEEEINEKMKMSEDVKKSLRKEIFTNIIICACLVAYFIFLFLGGLGKTKEVSIISLRIFSTIYLITSIILFEIAYRKDNGKIAIHGIEILVIAIITLFLPYIIFELDSKHQKIYAFVGEYIATYYVIKCIYISIKRKKKYSKEVSDIKEIIKKEKRQIKNEEEIEEARVIEKINEETVKKENQKKVTGKIEEAPKKRGRSKKQETIEKEKSKAKKEEPKVEAVPKKRGRPKKQETVENEKKTTIKKEAPKELIQKKEETPKKRGRPKKQETIEKEKSKAKVEETKTENTPKKRGRPRKVVTE